MNRSARSRRATVQARARQTRAAAKIRRTGVATLAAHCLAVGLTHTQAASVANSLRDKVEKASVTGVAGHAFRKGAARACTRYTVREVAALVAYYRPRKPAYRLAAAKLALAA